MCPLRGPRPAPPTGGGELAGLLFGSADGGDELPELTPLGAKPQCVRGCFAAAAAEGHTRQEMEPDKKDAPGHSPPEASVDTSCGVAQTCSKVTPASSDAPDFARKIVGIATQESPDECRWEYLSNMSGYLRRLCPGACVAESDLASFVLEQILSHRPPHIAEHDLQQNAIKHVAECRD